MPRFGERFINTMAGEANPHRNCTFVRVVRRRGRLNPGTWWEMTDERGDFWLGNPDTMVPANGDSCGLGCNPMTCGCGDGRAGSYKRCESCDGLGVLLPLGPAFGENPPCESCGGKGRHFA